MRKSRYTTGFALLLWILLLATAGEAGQACSTCASVEGDCCPSCRIDSDSGNWLTIGPLAIDGEGSRDSFNQYGHYPTEWLSSGRFHTNNNLCERDRLEWRWQDISETDGRSWARLAMWPLTFESNNVLISGRAWNALGPDPELVQQQVIWDRYKLRFHDDLLENVQAHYERFEVNRRFEGQLEDYKVQRIGYQYNFDIFGLDTRGQLRQTGTVIDTKIPGTSGNIDTTRIKLDANLTDDLAAYSNLGVSTYKYEELPDDGMVGADWTVGLNYHPDPLWLVNAELKTRENPDDNTVSSHIQNSAEYGLSLGYYPCNGNSYEAGYKIRQLDYAQLNMNGAGVPAILRGASVVTPREVTPAVTILTPDFNLYWLAIKHDLSDELRFTTRLDLQAGDPPGTELVMANSPSLFFDEQLSRSHGLSYSIDDCNQLDLNIQAQKSVNADRDSSNELGYTEGMWSHRIDMRSTVSLAYRDTHTDLDAPGFAGGDYTTDDTTYAANFAQDLRNHQYDINLAVSEGSGSEVYTQTSAGAGIRFKEFGPLGLRLDWYKRNYSNFPAFDSDALTVAVDYRINF
jgi:hypothetical protein